MSPCTFIRQNIQHINSSSSSRSILCIITIANGQYIVGQTCYSSLDCAQEYSYCSIESQEYCVTGVCQCIPGYTYNNAISKCVPGIVHRFALQPICL